MRRGAPRSRMAAALVAGIALAGPLAGAEAESAPGCPPSVLPWPDAMLEARARHVSGSRAEEPWLRLAREYPVETDWLAADAGGDWTAWFDRVRDTEFERAAIRKALAEIAAAAADLEARLRGLESEATPPGDRRWLDLYAEACSRRRQARLRPLLDRFRRIAFTKHYNLGGSHYAYTEGLSDAQDERHFVPGSSLCILDLEGGRPRTRVLLDDPGGVIRDPDVSWDGRRILFAWKKSDLEDDYHLYDLTVETGEVRQLTRGLGFADYEGAYLPDGSIVFNSTRCVQTVDCWWTEVSNLYTCDGDGRFLRRLAFDQVHSNYPQVLDDGRVAYTRWDYSDRGQIYPQGLFVMGPDGTGQTALYGNNSWFPTTIAHARPIPGTGKIVAILTGHHSLQMGKLALIDVASGREENAGVRLIAPERETPAVRVDAYGQDGELFQYPYPAGSSTFLVALAPEGRRRGPPRFGIYLVTTGGHRELLASDPAVSCNQPVPLAPRAKPPAWASRVDYGKTTGTYYVQDVHAGPGLAGVQRGTVKRLRVVAIEYRAAGIGFNYSKGPGGGALSSTPVSVGNGCWDVKVVLGDARVQEDGSACFVAPARTPVYFQALDEKGRAVQTMRSWSTLQPGERASCVGCHEDKNSAPPATRGLTLALRAGPQELEPFPVPARGFSFPRDVQPILDRHCVRCHDGSAPRGGGGPGTDAAAPERSSPGSARTPAFGLRGNEVVDPVAKRRWSESYLALTAASALHLAAASPAPLAGRSTPLVSWIGTQSPPTMLPPYEAGSARSGLLEMLEAGHGGTKLSPKEIETVACWIDLLVPYCGDYREAGAWSESEREKYERFLSKRKRMEEIERKNVEDFVRQRGSEVGSRGGAF